MTAKKDQEIKALKEKVRRSKNRHLKIKEYQQKQNKILEQVKED